MFSVAPMRFAGLGVYKPREKVTSAVLDTRFGHEAGSTRAQFGLDSRRVAAPDETTSMMGAAAARDALAAAGWADGDFDVLIGACGVMEQPIPGTSVLVQQALGLGRSGILAFDVNQTCLSFLMALDVAAMGFATGRWRRALVVSSDIASAGLDWSDPPASAIFGDGAAAVCIEAAEDPNGPALLARGLETYGQGQDLATLRAGGTRVRLEDGLEAFQAAAIFHMDPFGVFKAAAKRLPPLIDRVLGEAGLDRASVDLVVPHQASQPGLEHLRRLMGGDPSRVIDIFADHGNQIAASIPSALHRAWIDGRLAPGTTVLLLGTAAGISVSAMVLRV
ncbi:3-oxoacyl-[acyl-carrier-protein] synthase III C-terminal domain-containing protein [Caulobacter sp. BE254]|uniref:3-oxoacyl-[acyl-carrier-protein] synthase III C-terminal domain-containing protein n=1 Tax=Caulobacter sp. BE254 TaxID=2817720 RepID=UPI0028610072|nr:3-oxoacyl-[acyl-carrier-protein] synthase III C-terminal domain-containing protein [Caulobacter sp. BE254]MDR7114155.1 3-oxoacyl-[acyl-carrier-protein] synthase-3 [Caulobacter sp. BE254]